LAVAGLAAFCLFFPPSLFKVKEVAVLSPPRHLSEFDLIRLSQVKRGDNLLTLSLSEVREKILRFPWIREVRLSKRFPGRLLIWVEEHRPAAVVRLATGKAGSLGETSAQNAEMLQPKNSDDLYLVSDEGIIFTKSESGQSDRGLPLITGLTQDDVATKRLLSSLISLIRFFKSSESLSEIDISEVRWSGNKGISVFTQEPAVRIELGEDRWEERLSRLDRSWKLIQTTAKGPKVIDLNFQKRIVVKQES
jgi:cell division septal protein FtsQ